MQVEYLKELLQTEEVINNAHLKEELERIARYQLSDEISWIPGNLSFVGCKFLLNNGLNPDIILKFAFNIDEEFASKQEQFVTLALDNKANPNSIDAFNQLPSANILKRLLEHGLDKSKALSMVFKVPHGINAAHDISSNNVFQSKINLAKSLVEQGASFKEYCYLPLNLPYEAYESFLSKGWLKGDVLLQAAAGASSLESRQKLIELSIKNKANLNSLSFLSGIPSVEELNYLLEKGLSPTIALNLIINKSTHDQDSTGKYVDNQVAKKLKQNAIKLLLENGAKIDLIDDVQSYSNFGNYDFLLQCGLNPNHVMQMILESCRQVYKPNDEKYILASLSDEYKAIIDLAISKGGDVNRSLLESLEHISRRGYADGNMIPNIIPHQIMAQLVKEYSLKANIALEYAIRNGVKELADFVIGYGVDVNAKTSNGKDTLLELALANGNMENIELLLENGAKKDISSLSYLNSVCILEFSAAVKIVQKFSSLYNKDEAYTRLRAQGVSESEVQAFLDFHELIADYISATKGDGTSLSLNEQELLNTEVRNESAESYLNTKITNPYGFSLLHLAIIAGKYKLAENMIKSGFDVYAKSNNNITPLQLISRTNDMDVIGYDKHLVRHLIKTVFNKINNVDIDLGGGVTLADILMKDQGLASKVIEKTNDKLFYFFKEDSDLLSLSKYPDKTHIAISHGEGLWSSGVPVVSRLIMQEHKDVLFYLITDEMITKGGEAFVKQFDAFINPGAHDSYPRLPELTKADCPFSMDLEQHYQNILDISYQLKIPYLGVCAGAQHLSMYHGGSLAPLKGYNGRQHNITFIKGTLPHYLALTKQQQQEAIKNCELPSVTVRGDTAHNYAAVINKLGVNMQLGAVSEDNVPMAYAHKNAIRFATQFHPEHHYNSFGLNAHEKAWLDNFISIAMMHHEYRVNDGRHPIEYYQKIQDRLETCLTKPDCLPSEFGIDVVGSMCMNQTIDAYTAKYIVF